MAKAVLHPEQLRQWMEHPLSTYLFNALKIRRADLLKDALTGISPNDQYMDRKFCSLQAVSQLVDDLIDFNGLQDILSETVEFKEEA